MGHNEHSLSLVWGTDARSRNNERPAGVAEMFQVSNAIVECHADDSSNILSNDPRRPELLHNAKHFWPEETVVLCAFSLPGDGERLAGEPAGDEGRAFDAGRPESVTCNGSHVVEPRHVRPVFREDALAIWISFDLGDGAEPRPLRGEVDPPCGMPENRLMCVNLLSGMRDHPLEKIAVLDIEPHDALVVKFPDQAFEFSVM